MQYSKIIQTLINEIYNLTKFLEDYWIEEGDYEFYFKKIKKNEDVKGIVKIKIHIIDEDGIEQTMSVVADFVYQTTPISNSSQWLQFKSDNEIE